MAARTFSLPCGKSQRGMCEPSTAAGPCVVSKGGRGRSSGRSWCRFRIRSSHFESVAGRVRTANPGHKERYLNAHVPQGGWPALVLNADFRPLSYYPLSLWTWQDAIKAVFLDRVYVVSELRPGGARPSFEMPLPSVVSLKSSSNPPRIRPSPGSMFSCGTSFPASTAAPATN